MTINTKYTYLIEAWLLGENTSRSAGLYWKGHQDRMAKRATVDEAITKDPFEALKIDQPAVAEQFVMLLNDFEPTVMYAINGRWNFVLHGFEVDSEDETKKVHIPYPSEAQIVEHVFTGLSPGNRAELVRLGGDGGLGTLHHGFGMWIRNTYNLWHSDNPHTMKGYEPELRDGVDFSQRHPDQTSMRIIEAMYQRALAEVQEAAS